MNELTCRICCRRALIHLSSMSRTLREEHECLSSLIMHSRKSCDELKLNWLKLIEFDWNRHVRTWRMEHFSSRLRSAIPKPSMTATPHVCNTLAWHFSEFIIRKIEWFERKNLFIFFVQMRQLWTVVSSTKYYFKILKKFWKIAWIS